jgi:hypothetical protein
MNTLKLILQSVLISILILQLLYTSAISKLPLPASSEVVDSVTLEEENLNYQETYHSLIDDKVLSIYEISLPLAEGEYYSGKFQNASAGVDQLNSMDALEPGDQVALLSDQIIYFSYQDGYINTPKGYAFGVCWSVTALGGLIDEANKNWKEDHGYPLFIVKQSSGHGRTYETYYPNNNYGYAVLKNNDGSVGVDYIFQVNPKAQIDNVLFYFEALTDNEEAYGGYEIRGWVTVKR